MKLRLPKRRRYRALLYILSFLLILAALDLVLLRIGRHITIAPDTTFITTPLKPDGTPNYIQALDDLYSAGITDDNNAAPLLLSAFNPETTLAKSAREQIYARLHMPLHPAPVPFQDSYSLFLHPDGHIIDGQQNDDEIALCRKSLWKESDHPALAAWLRTAGPALDFLHVAVKRPRYYVPYGAPVYTPIVRSLLLPSLGKYNELANAACLRAMLRASVGDLDGARSDLLAVHRFARLVGQGRFIIERLVAVHIDSTASDSEIALAAHNIFNAAQSRQFAADLHALPPLPPLADALLSERFSVLNGIAYGSRHNLGITAISFFNGELDPLEKKFTLVAINLFPTDINAAMRQANTYYDRLSAAARAPLYSQQETLQQALEQDFSRIFKQPPPLRIFTPAKNLLTFFIQSIGGSTRIYAIQHMQSQLAELALALSAYHSDHHAYPPTLAALAPDYLPAIPEDLFINQPLHYTLTPPPHTGYTLYSVGPNMTDDAGQTRQHHDPAHNRADDLTVTVP
jgi:hypothetical protein